MTMSIHIPSDIPSGKLRIFEDGAYDIQLMDIFFGMSSTGNPKLTAKYVVLTEPEDPEEGSQSTIGENVLETFSLQPQALFNLNDLFIDVTGAPIPQGDWSTGEEFANYVKEVMGGATFRAVLVAEKRQNGEAMMIKKRTYQS